MITGEVANQQGRWGGWFTSALKEAMQKPTTRSPNWNRIQIERLAQHVRPFGRGGWNRKKFLEYTGPEAIYVCLLCRGKFSRREQLRYDLGRVYHFRMMLKAGRALPPIQLDQQADVFSWGPPVIIDGCHRFAAAILNGEKTIRASCSGLVQTIRWLQGKTDNPGFD